MPRGSKSSYTDKQKRQARHIEEGYEKKGLSRKTAAARAWATVNKETGGGLKSAPKKKKAATKKKAVKKSATKKTATKKKTTRKPSTRKRTAKKK